LRESTDGCTSKFENLSAALFILLIVAVILSLFFLRLLLIEFSF
jgi:hypothetical protein